MSMAVHPIQLQDFGVISQKMQMQTMQMLTWTGCITMHALILHAKLYKVKYLVNTSYFDKNGY